MAGRIGSLVAKDVCKLYAQTERKKNNEKCIVRVSFRYCNLRVSTPVYMVPQPYTTYKEAEVEAGAEAGGYNYFSKNMFSTTRGSMVHDLVPYQTNPPRHSPYLKHSKTTPQKLVGVRGVTCWKPKDLE